MKQDRQGHEGRIAIDVDRRLYLLLQKDAEKNRRAIRRQLDRILEEWFKTRKGKET